MDARRDARLQRCPREYQSATNRAACGCGALARGARREETVVRPLRDATIVARMLLCAIATVAPRNVLVQCAPGAFAMAPSINRSASQCAGDAIGQGANAMRCRGSYEQCSFATSLLRAFATSLSASFVIRHSASPAIYTMRYTA